MSENVKHDNSNEGKIRHSRSFDMSFELTLENETINVIVIILV